MALFMLYIGWVTPAGVLIYWVTSSAWQVGQQSDSAHAAASGREASAMPTMEATRR